MISNKKIIKILKLKIKDKKGQALVETAIVLPIIIFCIFAMISFGIYFFDMSVMLYACNKAIDKGVGNLSGAILTEDEERTIKLTAQNATGCLLMASDVDVEVVNEPTQIDGEHMLKVRLSSDFKCVLPFLSELFKNHDVLKVESFYVYKQ